MIYRAHFTILAGTPANEPVSDVLDVAAGIIQRIHVLFPPGSAGKAHLVLFYQELQIAPRGENVFFSGDDTEYSFDDWIPILERPYVIDLIGWAPDTVFDHIVYVTVHQETALGFPAYLGERPALPEEV